MERALAVVDADESSKALVREAGELAAAVGAELVVIHVTSDEEYEEMRQKMERIPDSRVRYSAKQAVEGAEQFAADVGREVLEGIDVSWEALGKVGDAQTEILDAAAEQNCDHLFVAGEKRSPTGKALFGDITQALILNFGGAVTVVTE
ncbi:universal stress protein [Halorussus litoreus]|uniref:universal stress protein n=1 Tax=Halorussus litoreus TaxID=1710536 RepID=UPI000E222027|nr:universal stress protein [Halorussus litoreus]